MLLATFQAGHKAARHKLLSTLCLQRALRPRPPQEQGPGGAATRAINPPQFSSAGLHTRHTLSLVHSPHPLSLIYRPPAKAVAPPAPSPSREGGAGAALLLPT
jgi:hypothetical protein